MRAIILAAGRGSRMGKLTDEQPKCLAIVKGRPLIEHQISALTDAGIKNIAIVTGYKAGMLQKYGTYHFHNEKWHETNMVFSLLCAREWLDNNDCIVSYSDIYYGFQIVKDLIVCPDDIAVAYDPNWHELWSKRFNDPLDDAETFRIGDDGYITQIGLKPRTVEEIQGQYMGLLKFKKKVFVRVLNLTEGLEVDHVHLTSVLEKFIMGNIKLAGIKVLSPWGECDNQKDLIFLND